MGLGLNVAALRKRRGLTLDALEQISGVDRAVISALERRKSAASKHVASLAAALGVSVDALLGEDIPTDDEGPALSTATVVQGEQEMAREWPFGSVPRAFVETLTADEIGVMQSHMMDALVKIKTMREMVADGLPGARLGKQRGG